MRTLYSHYGQAHGRPIGRPRHRWKGKIKTDFQEVGYEDMGWIKLAQDRDRWLALVNAVMNLRIP
jgi:hypothetical protein